MPGASGHVSWLSPDVSAADVGATAAVVLRRPALGRHRASLAGFLGAVERLVRALEERDRVVLGLELGDAGRQLHPPGLAERAAGDRGLDPPEQLVRLLDPGL